MNKGRSRFTPVLSIVNGTLESRLLLSGIAPTVGSASALHQNAVELDARTARKVPTNTLLTVSAGTLGQPITFTVTVRSAATAGSPAGTVNIIDHGVVIQTLTLSPTTSPSPRYAYSDATYTLRQQPGGSAYFFGKHAVSAVFNPGGTFLKSKGTKIFTVNTACIHHAGRRREDCNDRAGLGSANSIGTDCHPFLHRLSREGWPHFR